MYLVARLAPWEQPHHRFSGRGSPESALDRKAAAGELVHPPTPPLSLCRCVNHGENGMNHGSMTF